VVGFNIPKYYLSPVISRSFHAIEGILSHFLLLPNLARSGFSTYLLFLPNIFCIPKRVFYALFIKDF